MTSKKISSAILRKYNAIYENQYDGLSMKQIINKFMTKLDNYIDVDLEKEHCSPQYFLTSLSLVGSFGAYIYHGSFPKEYESELMPIIKQYLVYKFGLRDFSGFILKIHSKNSIGGFVTIKLRWNQEDGNLGSSDNGGGSRIRRNRKIRKNKRIRRNSNTHGIDRNLLSRLEKIESRLNEIMDTQKFIQETADKQVEIIDKIST